MIIEFKEPMVSISKSEFDAKIAEAKAEVAREIFEEIEDCMKCFEDDDDGYLLKKCEFEFFVREIRDKYTESENG